MRYLLDTIDVSSNMQRAVTAVRGITGLPALILACVLALTCVGLLALIWFFDLDATLQWTQAATQQLIPTLPPAVVGGVALVTLALTLLPTLIELFTARFALAGIKAAAWLIYLFGTFDMVTDYPRVAQFWAAYRPAFDPLGWAAEPVFILVRSLWLFLASFGFEAMFCILAVAVLVLLLNIGARPARGAQP